MSRQERLSNGLAMTKRLFELVDANDWGYMEVTAFRCQKLESILK